jgi:hypothetical protein
LENSNTLKNFSLDNFRIAYFWFELGFHVEFPLWKGRVYGVRIFNETKLCILSLLRVFFYVKSYFSLEMYECLASVVQEKIKLWSKHRRVAILILYDYLKTHTKIQTNRRWLRRCCKSRKLRKNKGPFAKYCTKQIACLLKMIRC